MVATLIREIEQAKIGPQELLKFLDRPWNLDRKQHRDRAVIAELEFAASMIPGAWRLAEEAVGRELWPVEGGSLLTGTNNELMYVSIATGTQLNTFTAESNLMATLPPIILPAGFFMNGGLPGRSVRFIVRGRLGSTSTPTFTFSCRILTSSTWSAAGVVWSSAAITVGSGVTLAPWMMEMEIVARSVVAGATGLTLEGLGFMEAGTAFAAAGGNYSMPGANVSPLVTLQADVTQYLFASVACGTSNAANLCQAELIKAYGEN